jgi:WD40 repeat protein
MRSPVAFSLVAAVALGLLTLDARAEPPATTEVPALRFARRDAQRATAALQSATETAAAAAAQSKAAADSLTAAQAAAAAAKKAAADSIAAVKAGETAKTAAEKVAADAAALAKQTLDDPQATQEKKDETKLAAEKAAQTAAQAVEQLKALVSAQTAAEAAMVTADAQVTQATAAVKPATEAKAATEKAAAALGPVAKEATDRLAFYEATPPKADPAAVRLVKTLQFNRPFMSCRIDPTGDYVFGGAQDNSIQRFDLLLGTQTPLLGHRSWVSGFDFQPGNPQVLVSAGFDGKISWWDSLAAAPAASRTIKAHQGQVRCVVFSRDGRYVATGGNDKLVRIWSAADGALVTELAGHANHVYNVAFHPDGKQLVSGDLLGVIKHWELDTWRHVRDLDAGPLTKYDPTFRADCGGVRGFDFSPDGRYLAAGGIGEVSNAFAGIGKPTVVLFDWLTGQKLHVMTPKGTFQGAVEGLQFHPSGEFLIGAGGGSGGGLWFWKPDQPQAIFDFGLPNVAYGLALHPDGMRLTVPLYDNTVRLYELGAKPPEAKPVAAK